tara:strand:- start:141 stop:320 length:180 start_codon:yes stop_codon:yes gene_type:complete
LNQPLSKKAQQNERLFECIKARYVQSGVYGSLKITHGLSEIEASRENSVQVNEASQAQS